MNWKKIKIFPILEVLREMEKKSLALYNAQYIVYSDGFEELTISYRRLQEDLK